MARRRDLLGRLLVALAQPGVDGVLATPDVIEDLLMLDALDGRIAIGSMNRGGLPGAAWELDDRFTAYDADGHRAQRTRRRQDAAADGAQRSREPRRRSKDAPAP